MNASPTPLPPAPRPSRAHHLRLPRHRLRRLAKRLLDAHEQNSSSQSYPGPNGCPIRIVCISDTHNDQPGNLPRGDILIHAGDLTEWGTFTEIQTQLTWLNSLTRFKRKIIIAGNHDILFDDDFLASHTETFPVKPGESKAELDFGEVVYLENSGVTLTFPPTTLLEEGNERQTTESAAPMSRELRIWGSPFTPKYLDAAFQYPRTEDVWAKFADGKSGGEWEGVDVLVIHGPPWGVLDGVKRSGCLFLSRALRKARPKLMICGHIHVGYGRQKVRFDGIRRAWEEIEVGWGGWGCLIGMALRLVWGVFLGQLTMLGLEGHNDDQATEVVNAAVVGAKGELANEAVVVYL